MKAIMNVSPLLKDHELRYRPIIISVNEFDEKSAKEFSQKMTLAHNTGQPVIPIVIDSYGGQVYSLMNMIAEIENSSLPIMTIAQGKAMSCGAVLLSYGSEGMRFAAPTATIMIHDVAAGAMGKVEDLKSKTKEANRLNKKIFSMMDKNCGKPEGFFLDKLQQKSRADWYLTAKKAKKHNLVNHLRLPTMKINIGVSITVK
jgi:ATP-dependent Clp protease protease subunit